MKIVIYGEKWCPFCKAAKRDAKKKLSKSVKLITGLSGAEMKKKLKLKRIPKTIPQIQVDGKYIGGYSNLVNIIKKKKSL